MSLSPSKAVPEKGPDEPAPIENSTALAGWLMIDGIPAVVGLAGPLTPMLVASYHVFTGRIVVRSEHQTIVRVLEKQIADGHTDRYG
ncbi:hypothetical protein [Arthrobacter flavus]|uniref:Uncharacterized protein n=1 Tax=Arthrobacter flavus TaxID=95172 RepID=A0ABW4Q8G4_9MICC